MKFFTLPNQMTLLRILLTPVFLAMFLSADSVTRQFSIIVFIIAALTDWYDGWLARRWGYVTRWGAFFDPLADKVVTSATLIAYAYLKLVPEWTVWIIVVRDIFITALRSYAEYKANPVDTSKLAKTKTFAQFVVIYYILIFRIAQLTPSVYTKYSTTIDMLMNSTWIYSMLVFIAAITLWTGLVYTYDNRKIIYDLLINPIQKERKSINEAAPVPSFPVRCFSSALFSGYLPVSGTFGSLVGLLIYFFIPHIEQPMVLLPLILVTYVLGMKTSALMEQRFGKDPAEVTIDEVVGMWVSLLFLPKTLLLSLTAFLLFRIFDIIKPYPARRIDEMKGGFGIMTDDVAAGIYANLVLQLLLWIPYTKHWFIG